MVYMSRVVIEEDARDSVRKSVENVFEEFGGAEELVEDKNVFMKVNAIDFRKQCYTSPVVIGEIIDVLKDAGASEINVMENVTQSNVTRVVFKVIGLTDLVKEKDVNALFLDEEDSIEVEIGEDNKNIRIPEILYENFVENGDDSFYLNVPKLKTHSMTKVTLGVKSQMGIVDHSGRSDYHNFELHQFLADLFEFIRPDFTLIDGLDAIIHGHYPLENKLDEYVKPMDLLIGGKDTLAVDTVGSRVLGYGTDEVEHLKILYEAGIGNGDLEEIDIDGDISQFQEKYPYEIIGDLPENVKVIEGNERACIEGCKNNTLMVIEMLHVDYGADGPFNVIFGKDFDKEELEKLNEGPVLIVGPCAIDECRDFLEKRYPDKDIRTVDAHNDLAEVNSNVMDFMGMSTTDILPLSWGMLWTYMKTKIHGSSANTPSLF